MKANYKIVGSPVVGGKYEKLDTATTLQEAKHLLENYRLAHPTWHIVYYNTEEDFDMQVEKRKTIDIMHNLFYSLKN